MRWHWIDRIVQLQKGEQCVAVKSVSLSEPHLHDHFPGMPIMPNTLIIEGMAQTAGILVGHARDFAEKVILAKIGRATFHELATPGRTLIFTATLDRIDDAGASTAGYVEFIDPADWLNDGPAEPRPFAEIELMFSHVDQNMRGLEFPEHNFVFEGPIMDLLRRDGVV
ncbi:MAG: beta-hydroxyacyl-ACP dehydratase [Planctomycetaceae bacterium]|jgi:3-hydroxyacyl-[acyl-carrier-protein] dehydratase|nr:beta-hydroxyacyl-ACP dehydratase [Planctomycetaceae bacterium]